MSYARSLFARSRSAAPAGAAVVGSQPAVEPLHEEHVEVVAGEPPRTASAPLQPRPVPPRPAAPVPPPIAERPRAAVAEPSPAAPPVAAAPPSAPAPVVRTHSREVVVEHEVVPAPPSAPLAPIRPLSAASLPPQAAWLAEEASEADPLVAAAGTDELRELMRSVRQWTASAPTAIATPPAADPASPPPAAAAAPPDDPVRVSIGNVTITVEDAPSERSRRGGTTHEPTGSDRLARNFIRGG